MLEDRRLHLLVVLGDVARLDVLEVVRQDPLAELQDPEHPLVRYGVEDVAALTPSPDVPAPSQTAQVVGDPRLRYPYSLNQLSHTHLAVAREQQEGREPHWVGEAVEKFRQQPNLSH